MLLQNLLYGFSKQKKSDFFSLLRSYNLPKSMRHRKRGHIRRTDNFFVESIENFGNENNSHSICKPILPSHGNKDRWEIK